MILRPKFAAPANINAAEPLVFDPTITDHRNLQHTPICIVEVPPRQHSIAGNLVGNGDPDSEDQAILQRALFSCAGETGYLEGA